MNGPVSTFSSGSYQQGMAVSMSDTPGAGTVTYELQFASSVNATLTGGSMFALETKK